MANVTVKQLLEAGAHFGHNTRYWNPKMSPYLHGAKNKIHLVNLQKTQELFHDALNFISKVASRRGKVLFVGTKRAASKSIREEALRCGMPFVSHRWLGGMLTNYKTVKQSIRRLTDLEQMQAEGKLVKFVKKEQLEMSREMAKLEKSLGGIKDMKGLPDALFVIDTAYESIAINEAKKLGIPVVAVVDTNNSFERIDYMVPGNDDSIKAIRLYTATVADAVLEGRASMQLAPVEEVAEKTGDDAQEAEAKAEKKTVKKTVKKAVEADADDAAAEADAVAETAAEVADEQAESDESVKKVAKKTAKKVAKKTAKKVAKKTTKKKVAKKTASKAADDE